jgi:hypothetical protein
MSGCSGGLANLKRQKPKAAAAVLEGRVPCDIYCAYMKGEISGKDDWQERAERARAYHIVDQKSRCEDDYTQPWEHRPDPEPQARVPKRFVDYPTTPQTVAEKTLAKFGQWSDFQRTEISNDGRTRIKFKSHDKNTTLVAVSAVFPLANTTEWVVYYLEPNGSVTMDDFDVDYYGHTLLAQWNGYVDVEWASD